jgi:uncharacterized phage protein (TIGR01671 family)
MREIKFRALNVDSKSWVYAGDAYEWKDFFYGIEDGQLKIETLGLYTGLKDRNGKEIYEGDIVKTMEWTISPKAKDGSDASFGKRFLRGSPWIQKPRYCYIKEREFFTDSEYGENPINWEVVGNIYENPELVKEVGSGEE